MRSSRPLPACGLQRRLTSLVLRKRGPGGAVLPKKQRVNIFLDGTVIEHFKTKAGWTAAIRMAARVASRRNAAKIVDADNLWVITVDVINALR